MSFIKNISPALFCMAVLLTQFSSQVDSQSKKSPNPVSTTKPQPSPRSAHSYYVKLSGPVTLGDTWIEFHPKTSLKPDHDLQDVALALKQPFNDDIFSKGKGPNKGKGILMPDGDVINPEIEVLDQAGNVFSLVYSGAHVPGNGKGGEVLYSTPYPQKFPKDREYKVVRIRSPRPIKCKAIYWFCDSAKDWP